jgi:hypothetical protein
VKYVPEWFPGAGFKTFARVARAKFDVAIDGPLDYVKELMKVSPQSDLSRTLELIVVTPMSLAETAIPLSLGHTTTVH